MGQDLSTVSWVALPGPIKAFIRCRGAGPWALWTTWGLRSVSTRGALEGSWFGATKKECGPWGEFEYFVIAYMLKYKFSASFSGYWYHIIISETSSASFTWQMMIRPILCRHGRYYGRCCSPRYPDSSKLCRGRFNRQHLDSFVALKENLGGFVGFVSIWGLPVDSLTLPLPFSDPGDSGDRSPRNENISRYRLRMFKGNSRSKAHTALSCFALFYSMLNVNRHDGNVDVP